MATITMIKTWNTCFLLLMPDVHPNIVSSTTVGIKGDGAVVYIGPNSLAMVQHMLPLLPASGGPTRILDLSCGSGI